MDKEKITLEDLRQAHREIEADAESHEDAVGVVEEYIEALRNGQTLDPMRAIRARRHITSCAICIRRLADIVKE